MEFDKDLSARQEARLLAKQAEQAQEVLGKMTQAQLDAIVTAVAAAFEAKAEELAEMAVQETGFGNVGDKFDPNLHNAVMHTEEENVAENTITQVFQKGFKLGDKIVRFAMVQVAN